MAIMNVKLELIVLIVVFDVGIVSQCVMRACLKNPIWLENSAKHPWHWKVFFWSLLPTQFLPYFIIYSFNKILILAPRVLYML